MTVEERLDRIEALLEAMGTAVERALDMTDDYTVARRWEVEFGHAWYEYRFSKEKKP